MGLAAGYVVHNWRVHCRMRSACASFIMLSDNAEAFLNNNTDMATAGMPTAEPPPVVLAHTHPNSARLPLSTPVPIGDLIPCPMARCISAKSSVLLVIVRNGG